MTKDTEQIVEVVFPGGGKKYSYLGDGNLRTGQQINNAPVNHAKSGKPYTAPVVVVGTHNIYGVKVGDRVGVSDGVVTSIPKPLKFLPGNRVLGLDRTANIGGQEIQPKQYMKPFMAQRQRLLDYNVPTDTTEARNRLLGV